MLISHSHRATVESDRQNITQLLPRLWVWLLAGPPMLKMHAQKTSTEWTAPCERNKLLQTARLPRQHKREFTQPWQPRCKVGLLHHTWGLRLIWIPLAALQKLSWMDVEKGSPEYSNCWCWGFNGIVRMLWWPLVIAHYKKWCFERKHASNCTCLWWEQ